MLYSLFRPLFFSADAELVHEQVASLMSAMSKLPGSATLLSSIYRYQSPLLKQSVCGLSFDNPVGMAAGFDKAAELYPFLEKMGFGFVESGTFTALAQEGNPKPRIFRFVSDEALVNRMGFNNPGAEAAARTVAGQARSIPRGINIGKSKVVPIENAADDYLQSLTLLLEYADYVAVNVSSPNTANLRLLQEASKIYHLLSALRKFIDQNSNESRHPLFVKFAPDLNDDELLSSIEAAQSAGVDGLILTNTSLDKSKVAGAKDVEGGLSGRPIRHRSTEIIRKAFKATNGQLPIIGVGGIFSADDALEKIRAGASLVQIYTGYIYKGPDLPKQICYGIDRYLESTNQTLKQIVGCDVA